MQRTTLREVSMKNVIVLGAGGNIAKHVIDIYETTMKGEPEKGSVISQKSLATLIAKIIESPEKYVRENLGVNKPNSK
jgi:hypothetical protein